jgi:hypothetical protein
MELRGLEEGLARIAAPGARVEFVTERAASLLGFVSEGPPREAGFFPGSVVAGTFPA